MKTAVRERLRSQPIGHADSPAENFRSRASDFKHAFYFDSSVCRQSGHADRTARMPALVTKNLHHEVGGAIHDLGTVGEAGCRVNEAAKPDNAFDFVEVAERRLELCQQVDGAGAGRLLPTFDRDAAAQLTCGDELSIGAKADLPRYDKHVPATDERHVVGNRACGGWQSDTEA